MKVQGNRYSPVVVSKDSKGKGEERERERARERCFLF